MTDATGQPEHKVSWVQECGACKGTGLYQGQLEIDGAFVKCHGCKGLGRQEVEFTYKEFQGLKLRQGVERVFAVNPGVCVSGEDGSGGVTYMEFLRDPESPDAKGRENRRWYCPAWWWQSKDFRKKPDWDECPGAGSFRDCPHFGAKHKCWERHDREFD